MSGPRAAVNSAAAFFWASVILSAGMAACDLEPVRSYEKVKEKTKASAASAGLSCVDHTVPPGVPDAEIQPDLRRNHDPSWCWLS